jgi:hypothetical protein
MKSPLIALFILAVVTTGLFAQRGESPQVTGSYLGQTPPGMAPELFGDNIITKACELHSSPVFTPDNSQVFWAPLQGDGCSGKSDEILFMELINNAWTEAKVVSFSSMLFDSDDPCMYPMGRGYILPLIDLRDCSHSISERK